MLIDINKIDYVELNDLSIFDIFEDEQDIIDFVSHTMNKVFEKGSITRSLSMNEWSILNYIFNVLLSESKLNKITLLSELFDGFDDDLINLDSAYYLDNKSDEKFTKNFISVFNKVLAAIIKENK